MPIGAPDSAEATDLVVIYLWNELYNQIPEIRYLYIEMTASLLLKKPTARQLELYKKKILMFFKI